MTPAGLAVTVILSALASAALIRVSMPLLRRYAMARPNARSSHRIPTPQGGGGPVVAVTLAAVAAGAAAGLVPPPHRFHLVLALATAAIAVVGAVDDIRPLSARLRLILQAGLVAAVVFSAPAEWRLLPALPAVLERALAVVAGVWFVNLTNFMDGIDGITVAEMAPVSAALAIFALGGGLSATGGLLAAALAGALVGFLVFNRPPAAVFLGDVGSLPIGLSVAAVLFEFASVSGVVPAVLLVFYYLFDATETLLLRLRNGENVFEAHRRHAYQNAVDGGWSAAKVDLVVLTLNILLILLAYLSIGSGMTGQLALLAAGAVATVAVSRMFRKALK